MWWIFGGRFLSVLPRKIDLEFVTENFATFFTARKMSPGTLVGLRTQTQNAAFFERRGPKRKPWPRGKPLNRKK